MLLTQMTSSPTLKSGRLQLEVSRRNFAWTPRERDGRLIGASDMIRSELRSSQKERYPLVMTNKKLLNMAHL